MNISDEAIVLNTTPLRDNSLVVHTLSREWGRRSFICRTAHRAFLQPLNILETVVTQNPKSDLWRISALSCAHPLGGIRRSAGKNAISMFIAEVLLRSLQEGSRDEGLYDWCISRILLLDSMEGNFASFHVRFLLDYCAAMGFEPTWESLLPFMDSPLGECTGNLPTLARSFIEASPADSMLIPLDGKTRSEVCRRLLKYLEFHLETPLHVRSLDVLMELF